MQLPEEIFGLFDIRESYYVLGAGGSQIVALQDAARICILFSVGAGGACTVSTSQNPVVNHGLNVFTNALPLTLTHTDYGPLVSVQWSAFSTPGTTLTVIEVFLRRKPQSEVAGVSDLNRATQLLDRLRGGTDSVFVAAQAGALDKRP